jgi:GT2 family glycosyltransferase
VTTTTYLAANFRPAFTAPTSVSVIVCAYTLDRWDDTLRAVRSLETQTRAPAEIILVVDHNEELLDRANATLTGIRVIRNDHQRGLSGARNTGIRAARGEIVAFLDDDAAAGHQWLADLVRHYDDPSVLGVGGSATAEWAGGGRPPWMPGEFDWVVGCSYVGQPTQTAEVRNLVGCNMSFRRQVFDLVGGFGDGIGRVGKNVLGCEETELCIRISQDIPGGRLIYDPRVNVRHRVSADRRRFRYFLRRCYGEGLSKAQVTGLVGADAALATERSYVRKVLPSGFLTGIGQLLTFRPAGAARSSAIVLGLVATSAGYLQGHHRNNAVRRAARAEIPVSDGPADRRHHSGHLLLRTLVFAVAAGLFVQGLAVTASRQDRFDWGLALYFVAVMVPFVLGVVTLACKGLSGRSRRGVVVALGIYPTIIYRLTDPFLLTGYDEQLHLRTLNDLLSGAPLFSGNPLLEASATYPGLELFTMLMARAFNLPTMAAITAVVLLCRITLVLTIFRLGATLTRDPRSASLAVAFYAASPQFYFFNSQFAYQTLALSLAVGGLLLLRYAASETAMRTARTTGALICFAAVTMTHHLTSWCIVAALAGWAVLAPRSTRRLITSVTVGMGTMVVLWAAPIANRLGAYLGPVFHEAIQQTGGLLAGSGQGTIFSEKAGVATPGWERAVLVAYAIVCTVTAAGASIAIVQRAMRHRSGLLLGLGLLCMAYPAIFAVRMAPKAAEISDRATTFAFLPLALGIAFLLVRRARHRRLEPRAMPVALSSIGYLGGVILGSGPDWARLPGSYLVVADSRSLDPETLAAVEWSRQHLTVGSTIMADRVPGTLLASRARLWVETTPSPGVEPATLYFSETWGPEQTETARRMNLRYLYVDSRLADELPRQAWYFYAGENAEPRQLTLPALTKFAGTPGIIAVYRHGPVAIYDLHGLGVENVRAGWLGHRPEHRPIDGGVGLIIGVLLAWQWTALVRRVRPALRAFGGVGTACVAMSVGILLTAVTTASGFRPSWVFYAMATLPAVGVALVGGRGRLSAWVADKLRFTPWPSNGLVALVGAALILAVAGAALALRSAWLADFDVVGRILMTVGGGT